MDNNKISCHQGLTAFEAEEIRIKEQEIEIRLKELELKEKQLKLQRRWFRNPTVISGIVIAYLTAMTASLGAFYGRETENQNFAIEYTKIAVDIIKSTSQKELKDWANKVLGHFANSPFQVYRGVKSKEVNIIQDQQQKPQSATKD